MGYKSVGKVWTPESLQEHLSKRVVPNWIESVTFHHTASPSLAMRPNGLKLQHIRNIESFYRRPKSQGGKGWSSAPHLFLDEDQIYGMCEFRSKGIHARSFNKTSLGVEVLGDYDVESPKSGRGLACWKTAAATARVLFDWLGIKPTEETLLFHRDDPLTQKSCPGKKVTKDWFLGIIPDIVGAHDTTPSDKPDVGIPWKQWHFAGEQWCVPVLAFLAASGIPTEEIIAKLNSKGGKLYYDSELLDGGFYVPKGSSPKPDESTWAPVRDLTPFI